MRCVAQGSLRMGDLEGDTRVSGGGGEYDAELCRDWEIWGPNGGYVASIALRAAGDLAAIKRPASFYCHFIRTPRLGRVTLKAEAIQRGKRAESIRVSLFEDGKTVLEGMLRT